jgi:FkbM family methyltransferase
MIRRLAETAGVAALVGVCAVLVLWAALRRPVETVAVAVRAPAGQSWLHDRFGPKLYSQNDEELIIRDYFQDRRGGTFLDVGANDYKANSTTYYLEERLGWGGVAIDAIADYAEGYRKFRPKTTFVPMFVSDVADRTVDFYVVSANRRLSSGSLEVANDHEREGLGHTTIKVPTTTLNAVLDHVHVTHIDFVSLDIEMYEPMALAGFDIDRFRPELLCVEAHPPVAQAVLNYMAEHDYVVVARYLNLDPLNLYFAPRTSPLLNAAVDRPTSMTTTHQ